MLKLQRKNHPFVRVGTGDPLFKWTDTVQVTHIDTNSVGGGESVRRDVSLDAFRTQIMNDPNQYSEIRVDTVLDLTSLGAAFLKIATVPQGGKVKSCGLYVQTAVGASSGSGLSGISIGLHGTSATLYLGTSVPLTAGATLSMIAAGTVFTASTDVELCGVNPNGSSLSVTNITAGKVHCVLVYDTPNALTA